MLGLFSGYYSLDLAYLDLNGTSISGYIICIALTDVLCLVITQERGLKKHMKRLNAPKHRMLDKLGGAFVYLLLRELPSSL